MLILVLLYGHERFASRLKFMYHDASHLQRSCSHNRTKINIKFLTNTFYKIILSNNIIQMQFVLCNWY